MIIFTIILIIGIISFILVILGYLLSWRDRIFISSAIISSAAFGIMFIIGAISISLNSDYNCGKERIKYENQVTELNRDYSIILNMNDDNDKYIAIQQYNSEVKAFKDKIKQEQYWLNNEWVNWFHCKEYLRFDVNAVDYINIYIIMN